MLLLFLLLFDHSLVETKKAKEATTEDGEQVTDRPTDEPITMDIEVDAASDDEEGEQDGAAGAKSRQQRAEEQEYEEDEEEDLDAEPNSGKTKTGPNFIERFWQTILLTNCGA